MKRLTVLLLGLALGLAASPNCVSAAIYMGNGNAGFGGVFGTGSLELTNVGTNVSGTLTRGGGGLNDALVLYLDTTAGGFTNTGTFDDTADGLRRAISGFGGGNRSTVNFAAGFDADFAIALDQGFAGLWSLSGPGSHTFISSVNLTPTGNPTSATYGFSFDLLSIGLGLGDSFDFVGTYLNSGNAFRSDEAFGSGIAPGNPGQTAVTFTNFNTFATAIPEPSSVAILTCCGGLLAWRRRKATAATTA